MATKTTVGLIGWRGMVGSVLVDRMTAERDFDVCEPHFFSTSQAGAAAPIGGTPQIAGAPVVRDAFDLDSLAELDVLISCQGGDYTARVHPDLRRRGWSGFWIDAASTLRLSDDAVIVLDPVNRDIIDRALDRGVRDLVGGNCTVSLMLMALAPLIRRGWVEWLSSMTYQAASGAGAAALVELCEQMRRLGDRLAPVLDDPGARLLELDRQVAAGFSDPGLPISALGAPLAASLIPWIDRAMEHGDTREEWKGMVETQRILDLDPALPVDGICVRVGALRCHSQAVLLKLRRDLPLADIEAELASAHPWLRVIENTPEATRARLTPAAVSGSLEVAVGRLRKMRMGPEYLGLFTVGDQLLWGAAEPLRRALRLVLERVPARRLAAAAR